MITQKKTTDKFYVQSINRALKIVDEVSKSHETGLSLSEISEKLKLPVSTVYRIVQNLVNWQYLTESAGGNYVLGFSLLTLGHIVQSNLALASIARKYMEELSRQTSETIYLAMLDRFSSEIIYIEKIESLRNVKLSAGIGSHNPIHATANGKSLVCRFSKDKIREMLGKKGMPPLTPKTITDVEQFIDEVEQLKQKGFALDDLEHEPGVRCVAAPIFDYTGNVVASISISGIESNMDLDLINNNYGKLVKETALKISQQMGYRGETATPPAAK